MEAAVLREDSLATTTYELKIPAVWLGLERLAAGSQLGVAVTINDG